MTTAPIEAFIPSPTNPRTRFGGPEDEALVENIRLHGIIQPIVVRPAAGTAWRAFSECDDVGPFEIVCGHRRHRAAQAAGLEEIPYVLKDLSDEEAATIQLIENLQREDLDALDEAEGYQRMIREHGYSADRLADEIGKSRSYIYGRLKLTSLCPAGKAAMREGRLEESIALMLARIPGAALQEKALNGVLNPSWSGADPMTHREASRYIRDYYTLNLGKAPFSTADTTLPVKAGGCQECPHRSGNAPLLFPDIDNPEICTNPECFAEKKAAHVARQKALAEAEGKKVIEGEAAQKLITGQYHGGLKGHVNLDDKAYDLKTGGELRTYREILGDALDESQTVIIENPHKGEVIEALPNSVMAKALEKAGLKPAGAPQFDRQKEEERKAREETAWRRHLHNLVQTLRASTLASKALLLVDELVMVTLAFWEAIGHDQRVVLAKLWHQPEEKMDNHERERAFTDRIPGLSQAELLRLQLDLAMAWELTCHTYSTRQPTRLLAAAERAGIDVEAEKITFKVGNEAKKAGKTVKTKEKEVEKHGEEAQKTKRLGAFPNKHGVYTCEPDEIIKWSSKNDRAEIRLLELENGKWLYALKTAYSQGGSSSPLILHRCVAENREEALQANKPDLEYFCRHLKGAAINSYKLWLSALFSPAETISTPPEAAQAAEVIAPEPKAAQASDENPGEGEVVSPADAGECDGENPAQAETRVFQVGDVVRIEKATDGGDDLDEHVGKYATVIDAPGKQIGTPWIAVRVHGTDEEITVYVTEATWVGGGAVPSPEEIETDETPSTDLPPLMKGTETAGTIAEGTRWKTVAEFGSKTGIVLGYVSYEDDDRCRFVADDGEVMDVSRSCLLPADPPQAPAEAGAIETDETPAPTQPPLFETGARVRVKADAKGPNGIRCKCAGRVGTVTNKGTDGCRVKFDPGQGGEPTANVLWSNLEKLEIETNEKPSYAQRAHLAKLVKYRHPSNAELCWSGRGRQPAWVANWINDGGTLDDLAAPTPKPAKAGKRQQEQAVTTCAEAAHRCDKTMDMFESGAWVGAA